MNPFSRKKQQAKLPKAPEPRELADIQTEYNQLSARAGQNQYQSYVLGEDLKQINQRLVEVNQEAAYRNKLDKEKNAKSADEAATTPEAKNE